MFVTMFVVIFCGYPVAFVLGGTGLAFALFAWALGDFPLIKLSNILLRMWGGVAVDPVLVSLPMFIFMGAILERSGVAKDMLDASQVMLRRMPGGLAIAVMVMGTILAAPIGVVGASVVMLSLISLPPLLKAGYDKRLSIGTIGSAGTLGILIPPSIMLVVMAEMLNTSAGALFAAATIPGFVLSGLYLLYIWGVALVRPDLAPKLPPEHGPQTSRETLIVVSRGMLPMTVLMVVVLGSIFAGWATATESAGVGCLGATGFSMVFRELGGDDLMLSMLYKLGIDTPWEMMAFVMVLIFLLGFPFEWIEICLIVLPIFGPILMKMDFSSHIGDMVGFMPWFATLVAVNLQTSFMSPPFGATLFYMKGTVPADCSMTDVYRGTYPFLVLQVIGLALCLAFPELSLWLPRISGMLD
ncbi:MAG: TRAP transporter large permease subunit [Alphaproteobacteria bacterium]|nr:TRAP transporter large permease subunit [Alphaproteobacteria bacterium]